MDCQRQRWTSLVAGVWMQSWAGMGLLLGVLSPEMKTFLGINQTQLNLLAVAKDLGESFTFLASMTGQYLPSPCLLLFGGLLTLIGYGCLYLMFTGIISRLPIWTVGFLLFVGTNGAAYFNTAALKAATETFPAERARAVSIMKGLAGLSGAVLCQIYAALYAPDQTEFLFVLGTGPFMVAMALMFCLRPVPPPSHDLKRRRTVAADAVRFHFVQIVIAVAATYLLGLAVMNDAVDVPRSAAGALTALLLVLLCVPVFLPIEAAINGRSSAAAEDNDVEEPLTGKNPLLHYSWPSMKVAVGSSSAGGHDGLGELGEEHRSDEIQAGADAEKTEGDELEECKRSWFWGIRCPSGTKGRRLAPTELGLLVVAVMCSAGSGLTVINNMGQIVEANDRTRPETFVSIMCVCIFVGTVLTSYLSEFMVRRYGYPRPLALAIAQATMSVGHTVLAMSVAGNLYAGTALVGLGYGSSLLAVSETVRDLAGKTGAAAAENAVALARPVGSLLLSALVTGRLYDGSAQAQEPDGAWPLRVGDIFNKSQRCSGGSCFAAAHFVAAGAGLLGALAAVVLAYRSHARYARIWEKAAEAESEAADGDRGGVPTRVRPPAVKTFRRSHSKCQLSDNSLITPSPRIPMSPMLPVSDSNHLISPKIPLTPSRPPTPPSRNS